MNPSTKETQKLQAMLQKAYANGTYEAVVSAINKRIKVKKDVAKGQLVDQIEGYNALNSTLNEEVRAAVTAEDQRRARAKARAAAQKKAETKPKHEPLVPKNAFSAGGAALEITKRKNLNTTY